MRDHVDLKPLLCVLVAVGAASTGYAQRRPDPPPVEQPPPVERPPRGFLEAYECAGSPRLLIYAHMLTSQDVNDLAMVQGFEGRIQPYFTHRHVTTLFETQGNFRNAVAFENLVQQNAIEAARLLTREQPADIVILFTFVKVPRRADGTQYNARYQLLDVNRGTRLGTHSWDMSPDRRSRDGSIDARRLEAYASVLAVKITEDFQNAFPPPCGHQGGEREFVLSISGFPSDAVRRWRDVFQQVPGITRVVRTSQQQGTLRTDVMIQGDALDVTEAAKEALALTLDGDRFQVASEFAEGWATLHVFPSPPPPRQGCPTWLNGDDDPDPAGDAIRHDFRAAWRSKHEPKIGIIINQEVDRPRDEQALRQVPADQQAGNGQGGNFSAGSAGSYVCVNCVVHEGGGIAASPAGQGDGRIPTDEDLLNAREMEDRLFRRFLNNGVTLMDLKVVYENLVSQQELANGVYRQGELARLLGHKAQAQAVISGLGRVVRRGNGAEVRYTFRCYWMATGEVMGAATVTRFVDLRLENLNQATEEMAAEAVGSLSCQMMRHGFTPPRNIEFELRGARSVRDVQAAAEAVRSIEGVAHTNPRGFIVGREAAGFGYFDVVYTSTCEEFIRNVTREENLPFHMDGTTVTCEKIIVTAMDK